MFRNENGVEVEYLPVKDTCDDIARNVWAEFQDFYEVYNNGIENWECEESLKVAILSEKIDNIAKSLKRCGVNIFDYI